MRIDLAAARGVYSRFEPALRAPTLSPDYVVADALRDSSLEPVFWLHEEESGSRFYHAFHLGRPADAGFADAQSAYGYGGPLANDLSPEFLSRAWLAYTAWCRTEGIGAEFVRFHPLLENWRAWGGEVMLDRETVWMDLAQPDPAAAYSTRTRRKLRKALDAGLRVEWRDYPEFGRLYREAMQAIGVEGFYLFPDACIDALRRLEFAKVAVCLQDGEVAGAALFFFGPELAEYHLSAVTPAGRPLGALTVLLDAAADAARRQDCKRLYLGGGTSGDPGDSLHFFKAGFSERRAEFRIGKAIHDPAAYNALRQRWLQGRADNGRVLFYR